MNDVFLEAGKAIIAVLFAVTGWIIVMLTAKVEGLQRDLEAHKLHSAETFVTKLDIKDIRDEIIGHLKAIEAILHKKADK